MKPDLIINRIAQMPIKHANSAEFFRYFKNSPHQAKTIFLAFTYVNVDRRNYMREFWYLYYFSFSYYNLSIKIELVN